MIQRRAIGVEHFDGRAGIDQRAVTKLALAVIAVTEHVAVGSGEAKRIQPVGRLAVGRAHRIDDVHAAGYVLIARLDRHRCVGIIGRLAVGDRHQVTLTGDGDVVAEVQAVDAAGRGQNLAARGAVARVAHRAAATDDAATAAVAAGERIAAAVVVGARIARGVLIGPRDRQHRIGHVACRVDRFDQQGVLAGRHRDRQFRRAARKGRIVE